MKYRILFLFTIAFFCAEAQMNQVFDSLAGYNSQEVLIKGQSLQLSPIEEQFYIQNSRKQFINKKFGISDIVQKVNYAKIASMPAANIDFEMGNFNGWNLYNGINASSVDLMGTFFTGTNNISIINGGTDALAGFTLQSPLGGNNIAKVNNNVLGGQQSKIQNKLFVTADKNLFKFAYAAVLQKIGHACENQSYFAVTIRDTVGKLLFDFFVEAPDSLFSPASCRGYNQANFNLNIPNQVFYNPWTIKCVDLSPYIGTNVFIEVIGASCALTGHYGYGYFDAKLETCPDYSQPNILSVGNQTVSLNPNFIYVSQANCSNTLTTFSLTAPSWPAFYYWNGPSGSFLISGATQTATSYLSGLHTLSMGNNSVCPITKSIYLKENNTSSLVISGTSSLCLNTSYTLSGSGANSYTWSNAQIGPTVIITPTSTGIFTLGLTGQNFITTCLSNTVFTYTVYNNPVASVSGNTNNCLGIPTTFTATGGNTYNWYGVNISNNFTTAATGSVTNFTPPASTKYTLTAINLQGCSSIALFTIIVSPIPFIGVIISNPTVCPGYSTAINFMLGALTHTVTDGFNTYTANGSQVVTPTATTIYTVTNNGNACGMASTVITIYTNTIVPILTIAPIGTLCSSNFTFGVSGGSVYTWSSPNGSVSSNQSVTAFFPPMTVSGIFTVSGAFFQGGCLSTQTININVQPTPTLNIVPNILCSGVLTTLTISGGGPTYTLTPADNMGFPIAPVFTTSGVFTTSALPNQANYLVSTAVSGCTSNPGISCYALSPLSISIFPNTNSVCIGGVATLTAFGAQTYTWSNGPTAYTNAVSPTVTTVYTVTSTNICGTYSQTKTVQFFNLVSPTITITSSNYTPCVNVPCTLTASGASSYIWAPTPISGSTYVATNPFSITYKATGTATNGCISSATININPLPLTTPTITGNFTTCPNTISNYSSTSLSTYSWSNGSLNYTTNFTPPGTFTLYGTSPNGCNSIPVVRNTYTYAWVPFNILPSGTTNICGSSTVNISLNDINLALSSYTWSTGAINVPTITVNPSVTTTYTLTGTNYATGCTVSVVKTVSVFPSVAVSFTPSATLICQGDKVSFVLTPTNSTVNSLSLINNVFYGSNPGLYNIYTSHIDTNGCKFNSSIQTITVMSMPSVSISTPTNVFCQNGPTINLIGNPGGGVFSGVNVSGTVYTPSNTGNSSVVYNYTDMNGCSNYDEKCFYVYAIPNMNVMGSTSLICVGETATLTASGANTYSWNPGGTGSLIVVSPTVTTTYTVIGDNNGCQSSTVITLNVDLCTFISKYEDEKFEMMIFPNPTIGEFNLISKGNKSYQNINIYNALGVLVYSTKIETENTLIDLSKQANGVYFIRIGSTTGKIIKQN